MTYDQRSGMVVNYAAAVADQARRAGKHGGQAGYAGNGVLPVGRQEEGGGGGRAGVQVYGRGKAAGPAGELPLAWRPWIRGDCYAGRAPH